DAPALATADLGIAMGEGTDVALETADMVLMKNDLAKINETISLSKRMNRVVKQNIFFSLAVIGVLIISNFLKIIDLPFVLIRFDAPALATADLGIAMGEGTDVALETADMVLMKNDLAKINETISLSKRMNRVVKQNIFFSLAVIGVLIISNFVQIIDLPLGVIGHEGSTILVILNGLRLLKS